MNKDPVGVIDILCHRNYSQRIDILQHYNRMETSKDTLIKVALKKSFSSDKAFKYLLYGLVLPFHEFLVVAAKKSMNPDWLPSIIVPLSNAAKQNLFSFHKICMYYFFTV